MTKYNIAVDFDGVINSYTSGWTGEDHLPDPPVDGAFAWLEEVSKTYRVVLHTARLSSSRRTAKVVLALDSWFRKHGLPEGVLRSIQYWTDPGKPQAVLYIDDRAYRFTGANFPSVEEITNLRPWGEK